MPYCTYIDGHCESADNALKCASNSTVHCREIREKNIKLKEAVKDEDESKRA
jgi:hypothetical protein